MAEAKICGLTTPVAVDAALAGGARMLGFMIFPKSPRNVSLAQAGALAALARGRAEIAAVTVDADDALLAAIHDALKPDWIQAHGQESPSRTASLGRYAQRGVIKAFGVARAEDLAAGAAFAGAADLFLYDAKPPPGADRPGGNGLAYDWRILAGHKPARPWMLSGGLTPENVGEAIAASGAALVDASSGLESAPGLKDPARIAAFLRAAASTSPAI
jgi:phosphoribosylanthranilate isomerase